MTLLPADTSEKVTAKAPLLQSSALTSASVSTGSARPSAQAADPLLTPGQRDVDGVDQLVDRHRAVAVEVERRTRRGAVAAERDVHPADEFVNRHLRHRRCSSRHVA
ncbi:MAG: hypothetical protein U0802_15785 [Candidatus Binatia bacterium]